MYKVFFNDRIVFINTSFNRQLLSEGLYFEGLQSKEVPKIWEQFITDKQENNLFLAGDSVEETKEFFFSFFKIVKAAGGLVYNQEDKLLCIERWGKWDLPKGKMEKHETKKEAALREVQEETGLHNVKIVTYKDTTYHIYQSPHHKGKWILKPTYWFMMRYDGLEMPVPQINEDITKAVWMSKGELYKIKQNTYASLMQLFDGD